VLKPHSQLAPGVDARQQVLPHCGLGWQWLVANLANSETINTHQFGWGFGTIATHLQNK